ncbi:MAG: ABC transporter ATP-binding protein [Pseudobdellovibrionaceae bacterium]
MSLKLNKVVKTYKQGDADIQVLKGLTAEIQDSEVVAILGQSGSGKSTLLSLMAGLDRPTSGSIQIADKEITAFSEEEMTQFRGQTIGIVFQQFHLFPHLTALENVMLPLEIWDQTNREAKAKEILNQMGLSHRLNHLPSQMSGGECQRVAIARALVVKPKIILADEPSGNLDTTTGAKVMDVFFEVVRAFKVTTILVTHSEALAHRCDRQLVLESGAL